ncbi:TIMELESS-interacting protein [Diachasmimorpha longicaudata]|uniref:TIMELESS-interacting protein n=1 Tax=Diachasmimorpha longicaudata TaxID=58733 RepID=UPI0030B8C6F2
MSHNQSDNEDTRMSLSDPESIKENPEEARELSGNEDGEEDEGKRVDPATSKKRITRREIPTLNPARLKGPKGVATIEKYFEGFKFHGKGHEKADLDRVMKRLEHWAHRLFPKYEFDDFLEKVEHLGTKRELQTYLTKYRKDMLTDDQAMEVEDEQMGEERARSPEPADEFDMLIAEQIERTKQVSSHLGKESPRVMEESDEEVKRRTEANRKMAMERRLAKMRERERVEAEKEASEVDGESQGFISQKTGETEGNTQETAALGEDVDEEEEMRKRIARNRQLAIERRLARMKQKLVEDTQNPLENVESSGPPDVESKKTAEVSHELGGTQHDYEASEDVGEVEVDGDKMELGKEMTGEVEKEVSMNEESLDTSKISTASSSGLTQTTASKKLLTEEELDKEIGAVVNMFVKGNRSSLQ